MVDQGFRPFEQQRHLQQPQALAECSHQGCAATVDTEAQSTALADMKSESVASLSYQQQQSLVITLVTT